MHAKHLATIAASFASVGHLWNRPEVQAVGDAAHGFWLANRFRCDAWNQRISHHRQAIDRCGTSRRSRLWHDVLPTLEEILISEPLTRVIAYLSGLLEQREADADWSALAHSVLDSHIEARHRCLNLMVFGYGFPVERAVKLNRLRRLIEFFNDQLLCALPERQGSDQYAFEASVVQRQRRQYRTYPLTHEIERVRLQTLTISLTHALSNDHQNSAAHPRLNQHIAEAVLGMMPPGLFDSLGVTQTRTQAILDYVVSDIDATSDDLDRPLVAPFDLLTQTKRIPKQKSPRR